jgi:hypothetical protein
MAVGDKLASSRSAPGKAQSVNEVVKARFQENHEVLTGNTLHPSGFLENPFKLPLAESVKETQLLFFLKLYSVVA